MTEKDEKAVEKAVKAAEGKITRAIEVLHKQLPADLAAVSIRLDSDSQAIIELWPVPTKGRLSIDQNRS